MTKADAACLIRAARSDDAAGIAEIYNHYVVDSIATFEEAALAPAQIAERIGRVYEAGLLWLVAEEQGAIIGYAYATPWNSRAAYRNSVETTVYIAAEAHGRGIGSLLYRQLFQDLRELPLHIAIAGISLPNAASITLHEKFGMEKVAHFSEVGYKFGRWVDVGYWQVVLSDKPAR